MTIVSGPTPESSTPGVNYARIIDPKLDALIATAVGAGSTNCKAWNAVQQRALKNYDWLPLASPVSYFFGRRSGNAHVDVDLRSSSYIEGETARWVTGK
jgi:ABC-type oligopeptide transport system substrate-binding subunit